MLNVTFFMEQQVGHQTFYKNLRQFIDLDSSIWANWVEVTYSEENNFWQQFPLVPDRLRGTFVGRSQVKRGLKQDYTDDFYFFNTQVPAALAGRGIRHKKYVLCTDITPIQYDEMSTHYGHEPDKNSFIKKYKFDVNKKLFSNAAKIIPWSNWVKTSLINDYGVDPQKITVVPPGVDLDLWKPAQDERIQNETLRILFVGGDFYRKGGNYLLEAFRLLPEGVAELHIVTRSDIAAADDVFVYNDMMPNSVELIQLFQSCDLFVLPTQAEAFGIAAVEASAIGLPVIATRVGGLEDIVVDGETGFLFESGDSRALGDLIYRVASDGTLQRRLSLNAVARVQALFDAQANATKIVEILKGIVIS